MRAGVSHSFGNFKLSDLGLWFLLYKDKTYLQEWSKTVVELPTTHQDSKIRPTEYPAGL